MSAGMVWLGTAFAVEAQVVGSSAAEASVVEANIAYPPSLEPLFSEESSYQTRCRFVQKRGRFCEVMFFLGCPAIKESIF